MNLSLRLIVLSHGVHPRPSHTHRDVAESAQTNLSGHWVISMLLPHPGLQRVTIAMRSPSDRIKTGTLTWESTENRERRAHIACAWDETDGIELMFPSNSLRSWSLYLTLWYDSSWDKRRVSVVAQRRKRERRRTYVMLQDQTKRAWTVDIRLQNEMMREHVYKRYINSNGIWFLMSATSLYHPIFLSI